MKPKEIFLNIEKYLLYLIIDVLFVFALVLIPIFSHWISFPLYLFEPMRFVIFCLILTTTRKNTLLLALLLPFISNIISGHPIFPKNILISIELITNVLLLYKLANMKVNIFISIILSVIFSKIIYYALKYALISVGALNVELISTPISYQITTTFVILLLFIAKRLINKNQKLTITW